MKEEKDNFNALMYNMIEGVAIHEMIFDGDNAVDYKIMNVNRSFENILNLKKDKVRGKLASEVYNDKPLIDVYSDVVKNKKPIKLEFYYEVMNKSFEISVAPWKDNGFITIFSDVTQRVNLEKNYKKDKLRLECLSRIVENHFEDNAFKFTHFGSIQIGYQLKENFLEFFVKDTGIGISKDKQNIIFERFRQAEDHLTRTYGGTGLGLSICKAYVEMMGGKIWVESEENKGSTFYFTIPYNSTHKHEVESEKNDLIFIVEDNEDVFLYLSTILKKKDVKFIHAENGREAIDIFIKNKENIKLILMDIRLPDIMGYEVIEKILKIKKVPIVAQSAYAFNIEREKAYDAGCVDYITKPIKIEQLNRILEKYF